jgi:hypothetical protein
MCRDWASRRCPQVAAWVRQPGARAIPSQQASLGIICKSPVHRTRPKARRQPMQTACGCGPQASASRSARPQATPARRRAAQAVGTAELQTLSMTATSHNSPTEAPTCQRTRRPCRPHSGQRGNRRQPRAAPSAARRRPQLVCGGASSAVRTSRLSALGRDGLRPLALGACPSPGPPPEPIVVCLTDRVAPAPAEHARGPSATTSGGFESSVRSALATTRLLNARTPGLRSD